MQILARDRRVRSPVAVGEEGTTWPDPRLAIAHRIVTDHGGRIAARSQAGRGETFLVRLPAAGVVPTGAGEAG